MHHLKNYSYLVFSWLFILACQTLKIAVVSHPEEYSGSYDKATMAKEAMELEVEKTKDPELGYVPRERLRVAYDEMLSLQGKKGKAALSNLHWKECGPSNVGGRTRAILWDPNDPTRRRVFAGAVSGGLWYTDDIYAENPNWVAVDDYFNNLAITTLAHHPTHTDTLYFGTGEGYFNGDAVRGEGIWRSIDGGESWAQLGSTNRSNSFDFDYVQKIVVLENGVVLAACRSFTYSNRGGILRSTDHGANWTRVLFSNTPYRGADIEVAANGDVYAAAGFGSTNSSDDGIWKSTDNGANWTKVYTASSSEERIEIACAPSDSNTVYAMVEGSSNSLSKMMKTTNGGSNWNNLSNISWFDQCSGSASSDITRGQAFYDLICAVDPDDKDKVFVGGIDLFKSTNGGSSWTQLSAWPKGGCGGYPEVHAD